MRAFLAGLVCSLAVACWFLPPTLDASVRGQATVVPCAVEQLQLI